MEKEKEQIQLPDNAFTELKPGEDYKPIMSPDQNIPRLMYGRLHGVSSWLCCSRLQLLILDLR